MSCKEAGGSATSPGTPGRDSSTCPGFTASTGDKSHEMLLFRCKLSVVSRGELSESNCNAEVEYPAISARLGEQL